MDRHHVCSLKPSSNVPGLRRACDTVGSLRCFGQRNWPWLANKLVQTLTPAPLVFLIPFFLVKFKIFPIGHKKKSKM